MARDADIDSPATTDLRRRILREKPFLRRIYEDWYRQIARVLPEGTGPILEVGAGASFLRQFVPDLITSDVLAITGLSAILDAHALPFADGSLRAIAMTGVFHHLGRPRRFLREAGRCVRPSGVLIMVEPWLTSWSRLVYGKLHHEPCRPGAADWSLAPGGPLSGANSAMPWIVFERDRLGFERDFPEWRIHSVGPDMPFVYLVSGGLSLRCVVPAASYGLWRGVERTLRPWAERLAMFARIVLIRQ